MSGNIERVERIYAAFGRGDVQFILDQIGDDASWGIDSVAAAEVPFYGIVRGKAAIAKFFGAIAESTRITTFEPHDFVAGGEHVFAYVRVQGTVTSTGKQVTTLDLHHWKFADGKVARWRGYEDTAATRDGHRK